jgi:hypothetical protein
MTDRKTLSTGDIAEAAERDAPRERQRDERAADPAATPSPDGPRLVDADADLLLFADEDAAAYRTRWSAVQTSFVDEPRKAVAEADSLVAEVMKRLAEGFATERRTLEAQWDRQDRISTEDLRLALRRYRAFFERLLKV